SYGLLKNRAHVGDPLELEAVLEGDILRVMLISCVAITPAGCLIYITPTNQGEETLKANKQIDLSKNERTGVFLGVKSGEKKEVGEPNPEEEPPRFPFMTQGYQLLAGDTPDMDPGMFIKIGEININDGQVEISKDFIPPCMTLGSHSKLQNQVVKFHGALKRIQEYSIQALRQITQTSEGKEILSSSPLKEGMLSQIQSMAVMIASLSDENLDPSSFSPPFRVISFFKGFFNNFNLFFRVHTGLREYIREEYFGKQLTASQGDIFFDVMEAFEKSTYNHSDLRSHFQQITQLLQFIEGVFKFYAGGPPPSEDTYVYEGVEYQLTDYKDCGFRQEKNRCYLTLNGFDSKSMQNVLILLNRKLISRDDYQKVNAYIGANEDSTEVQAEPSIFDTTKDQDRIVVKPRMEVSCIALKKLNLILAGNIDTRRLKEASKESVRVYKYGYLSERS
ncbi:MAG TPA: hypothetical protein VF369_06080, partial [candidate division Zixibacteria bacterium]